MTGFSFVSYPIAGLPLTGMQQLHMLPLSTESQSFRIQFLGYHISISSSHSCSRSRRLFHSLASCQSCRSTIIGRRSLYTANRLSTCPAMETPGVVSSMELPLGVGTQSEYASLSKLLLEFTTISSISKAWAFKSDTGKSSKAMFSVGQPDLLGNKKRNALVSAYITKDESKSVNFQWSPFAVEMSGVSVMVPSPSGSRLLMIRNPENDSPIKFEIWGQAHLEKEFHISQSIHGSVYADGWFEGISWNSDETMVAYVAEEPAPSKPTFNSAGFKGGSSKEKDCTEWKGQGLWEENWGETYVNKRRPTVFVINVDSGDVCGVEGIERSLTVGQVIWGPATKQSKSSQQHLIFVGWSSLPRKLGIKYCYNRPCALYSVRVPSVELKSNEPEPRCNVPEGPKLVNLTSGISSAFFPRFSPDGKFLVFLSAKSSVDSGAHSSTNSLHRIDWPIDGELPASPKIVEVVPIVMCVGEGCFPGLYCPGFLSSPWLGDGCTMVLSSIWGSTQVILSVNVLSGEVSRVTPDSGCSWDLLSLDEDNVIAVHSSPVDLPQIMYGSAISSSWSWQEISSPIFRCSKQIQHLMSSLQFSIMKIPVRDIAEKSAEGARNPFEAIFVSCKEKKNDTCDPLIVVIHGGPHSVSTSTFSKSLAFLTSIGFSLLIVNYRGSLGFGEEALQSLPGNIGSQDVNDVLTAIDHVIDMKLVDPRKIAVVGGSHGGFLTTHLIGQAPEKFVAAAARNPVCNLELMVGISDIPDWCFFEAYGSKTKFTEAPSKEDLAILYDKSPIAHIHKVKTPTLFLLGAKDLRVPISTALQYARALKERGVEVNVIMFPEDVHAIDRPQSDFESFLNIGVWFKKYCQ